MISFYKSELGVVMIKDDSYLDTMHFVVERPALDFDVAAHPDQHAAYLSETEVAPQASPEGAM